MIYVVVCRQSYIESFVRYVYTFINIQKMIYPLATSLSIKFTYLMVKKFSLLFPKHSNNTITLMNISISMHNNLMKGVHESLTNLHVSS